MSSESEWWNDGDTISRGIPFAVDAQGLWRDISQVERGDACMCFCPECKTPLVAKKGEIRVHHFAHKSVAGCYHSLERSLQGMALETLAVRGAHLAIPITDLPAQVWNSVYSSEREVMALKKKVYFSAKEPLIVGDVNKPRPSGEASDAGPDLTFPSNKLSLYFISSRKPYAAALAHANQAPVSGWRALGIRLTGFANSWWEVCDAERLNALRQPETARDQFIEWLAESHSSRGWLYHPFIKYLESQIERLKEKQSDQRRQYQASHQVPFRDDESIQLPASLKPPPFEETKKPTPPDRPDEVLNYNVKPCSCGSGLNEVRVGKGIFAGKRLLICSREPKHPMIFLGA